MDNRSRDREKKSGAAVVASVASVASIQYVYVANDGCTIHTNKDKKRRREIICPNSYAE